MGRMPERRSLTCYRLLNDIVSLPLHTERATFGIEVELPAVVLASISQPTATTGTSTRSSVVVLFDPPLRRPRLLAPPVRRHGFAAVVAAAAAAAAVVLVLVLVLVVVVVVVRIA